MKKSIRLILIGLFSIGLFSWMTSVAFAHGGGSQSHEQTRKMTIQVDGQNVEMEVKEELFDMDQDVNLKNALRKLSSKIHEGLESGDHGQKGLSAIASHFVSALDLKSMGTQAYRFANASNRSEKWREHIKNLIFLSFLTHGYEMSSAFVNYYTARGMGANDTTAYGAAAVGVVMAIPGFVDFVCWIGYGTYAVVPPFRSLIRVTRTATVRVSTATAKLLRLDRLQDRVMETIQSAEFSPQIRMRNLEMVGSLNAEKISSDRTLLTYTDPYYGTIKLETEVGLDSKIYVRRMTISEGIAKAWLRSYGNNKLFDDLAYFRARLLREFKAYGFNVRELLKETMDRLQEGETPELIHRFYVAGVGQSDEGTVVIDLIPDAVHISKARIIYPWETAKTVFNNLKCKILSASNVVK